VTTPDDSTTGSEPPFDAVPPELRPPVIESWRLLQEKAPETARRVAGDADLAGTLPRVWACSEFVAQTLVRYPADLDALVAGGGLAAPWRQGSLHESLHGLMASAVDEAAAMKRLREFRRREMIRVAWRDLAGWADLDETLGHVSELADACIEAAVDFASRRLVESHGQPVNDDGEPQTLIVLAMGKLGGRELNYSSDVDLVFLFESGGATPGPRQISHEQYFIRFGQQVIRLLDETTEDGFVFRVDMRLRPFGDSGPLAVSLPALEDYLQQHGRAWERYAYVKARPVTGYREGMGLYRNLLRPFVYRRYLDYGVYESLREMKALIEAESAGETLRDDVKRGRGGIREVEFIAQSLQILRGGADRSLRTTSLLEALPRLRGGRMLPDGVVDELGTAYGFLRRVENRLQQWRDRQIHLLPDTDEDRLRLAYAMDYPDWPAFLGALDAHRATVNGHFRSQLEGAYAPAPTPDGDAASLIWTGSIESTAAVAALGEIGYQDPRRAADIVRRLRGAAFVRRLDQTGRRRLDLLLPALIRECARYEGAEAVLERLTGILESVGLRSAYFALLNENPRALRQLAELGGKSDFLARQIAAHPLLLDELIDPRVFERLPDRVALAADLSSRMATAGADDLEGKLDALRQFQRSAVFLVAVADLSGMLPVMRVSDRLTDIAEAVLESCIDLASSQMEVRHGKPRCGRGADRRETGYAAVGYGKLGGLELGYGSDLDLVFVHDSSGEDQQTDGASPLDNGLYYGRLTRRLVHLLSTQTSSGTLYDVDTRLRPSGKGGLLVTSLDAFERYQREEAWTWEHQALLRARAVAGSIAVRERFESIRKALLCTAIRADTLREDVVGMRDRMRGELGSRDPAVFDIKQGHGGIADIEFLVQYRVLENASDHPALVTYPDNVRQLDSLVEEGILNPDLAGALRDAYLAYRTRMHHLTLAGVPGRVPADEFVAERELVAGEWERTFPDAVG
jgi:glutamate-ammonia-ligase adenylyltransferase